MKSWVQILVLIAALALTAPSLGLRITPEQLQALNGSALEELLESNGYELPNQISQWKTLLEKEGELFDTWIPFSGSPFHTDLLEPRYVASHHPYLYLAFIPRLNGLVDCEFISWNSNKGEADFGAIKNMGQKNASVALSQTSECITCHRTYGSIFTDRPWNNVTGANAPNGFHLSMAMLGTLIQQDPFRYGRFQDLFDDRNSIYDFTFGNLKPEPVVRLADAKFHEVPLFRFRGSFDFDANVRKTHLLVLTYQILKALPPEKRLPFTQRLSEKALLGALYPERLDYLFNWYDELTLVIKSNPVLESLPAVKSPIQKNLMPVFENPELLQRAGVTTSQVEHDPVTAIMKISETIRERKISGYRAEDLPNAGDPAFVDFKPAENASPNAAVNLLMKLTKQDLKTFKKWLDKNKLSLVTLLESPQVKSGWLKGNRFAYRREIARMFSAASSRPLNFSDLRDSSTSAIKTSSRNQLLVGTFSDEQIKKSRCLRCHSNSNNESRDMGFPFEPTRIENWEQGLSNPKLRPDLLRLASKIREKLQKRLMPPADQAEAVGFSIDSPEWKRLLTFLSQLPTQ